MRSRHVRVAGAGRIYFHDRKLPPAAGPDPAVHPGRTALVRHLPRRGPAPVPAQQDRLGPADLPVAVRRGQRHRTADRRPGRARRGRGRRSAAGGEETPGAGARAGRRHRVVRGGRGAADGRVQPGGPGFRGGPGHRRRGGAAGAAASVPGAGPAAGSGGTAGGLRERRRRARRGPARRGGRGPGGGRARGQPGRHLRAGRIHRRRGDGPVPGLLVGAGRHRAAHRAGRRDAGPALVHLRPGQSRAAPGGGRLSGGGHAQRRRVAGAGRPGGPAHCRWSGTGRRSPIS